MVDCADGAVENNKWNRQMTRDELVEAMVASMRLADDEGTGTPLVIIEAQLALSAIEASGLCIVPREPTDSLLKTGAMAFFSEKHDVLAARIPFVYRAMIEAGKL